MTEPEKNGASDRIDVFRQSAVCRRMTAMLSLGPRFPCPDRLEPEEKPEPAFVREFDLYEILHLRRTLLRSNLIETGSRLKECLGKKEPRMGVRERRRRRRHLENLWRLQMRALRPDYQNTPP